ncbi:UDP-N-acetylmuramoyl-L-alanyl-D-glutamate--2,6-diaminopimelate ligase [Sporolituus thermophilus]|uniref:UDP-N-acetylmuramoyl-L-alanyl-D-glutamate--2,6-diaminopimelate ligase n=1 Tax=Sporolituus thermophilus DSM 23256 TaxID=1123285 RepID=A0A1G7I3V7_9FIRM|nr:UDP-N-acetylmuramoyl-L-alanyl-D-glutamate--2,6-diaminopimelate ligase [Sporolituus thermophilus]SDF07278.1 UDP-N-acetylmuramoylalanyl-D-glutamate--2,6-diaminopimelate ligase [Sporolituus thermophilus DSM 23256]
MAKNLQELVALMPGCEVSGDINLTITAVTYDSRQAKPGSLFICLTGSKVDGHDYIAQARAGGAVAVLVEKEVNVEPGITVIKVPDTRAAMQAITPFFFDYPSQKLRVIGVTGTNGKTTTTHLIRSILMQAGYKVGLIGTIHTLIGDRTLPVKNTTPDVVDLQGLLAEMVAAGVDYAVMEVSSHALALNRTAGCEFDVGVFTNITRDHLDFHVTFENYIDAKAELFRLIGKPDNVKTGKSAVINTDDPAANHMLREVTYHAITYGVQDKADVTARNINIRADGAKFEAVTAKGIIPLALQITGLFNVYNVLAAIGVALAEGIEPDVIKTALEAFRSVPGRFEIVDVGQPFTVIVDYAHTPDGLENILKTARQFAQRRIIAVFGCGGDRDRTKRPIMGRLAAEYADVVVATSDNPRTEDPVAILKEIEVGIREGIKPGKNYEVIVDRRQAIARALNLAEPQDIVIIAGKGHETYQILKDKTIPFDDREVAREIIREMR